MWFSRKKFKLPRTVDDILRRFEAGQRYAYEGIWFGRVKTVRPPPFFAYVNPVLMGILSVVFPLGFMLITMIVSSMFGWSDKTTDLIGFSGAGIVLFGFWGWPWIVLLSRYVRTRNMDVWLDWFGFNFTRRCAAILVAGYGLTFILGMSFPDLNWMKNLGYGPLIRPAALVMVCFSLMVWIGLRILQTQASKNVNLPLPSRSLLDVPQVSAPPIPMLYLGQSTGWLTEKGHMASLAPGQAIALSLKDACQNIAILGGIGGGKTTSVIHPLLFQVMQWGWGGLIFDIKGNFYESVEVMASRFKRPITTIGIYETKCNLIAGSTPEVVGMMLKSAFILANPKADRFWLNTASEFCRHCLGVLSAVEGHYTLKSLYDYLFDEDVKTAVRKEAEHVLPTLPQKEQQKLERYLAYETKVWPKFDEKVRSGILATSSELFSAFSHPELEEAFSAPDGNGIDWTDVFNGRVFLLQLPLSQWGMGGKLIYTLLKLTFFNLMQQRNQHPEWNQDNPVVMLCDEYQEIVSASWDGLSDVNFWDKSRDSNMIGMISAQSISSFYAMLGNHDMSNVILQNFRQKLCFRVEDPATLLYFQQLVGQADVIHESYTQGRTTPDNWQQGGSMSQSTQVTTQQRAVVDAQLMRQLGPRYALAMLSINGHGADDVLVTQPLYVQQGEIVWPR